MRLQTQQKAVVCTVQMVVCTVQMVVCTVQIVVCTVRMVVCTQQAVASTVQMVADAAKCSCRHSTDGCRRSTSGGMRLQPHKSLSQIGWWNTVMVHLISCILLADFKFFSEFCNEVVHGNDILSKEHGEVLPSCSFSPHGNSN